jgi:anti-anti-sigma factor
MEVEVIQAGQEVVVWLRGEAGLAEAGLLETSLMRLTTQRPTRVIFNLSELRSLSSLAMGVLVTFRRAAVRAGVRVCRATALHSAVREALNRAELMDLFETVGSAPPCAKPDPCAESARKRYPSVEEVQRIHGIAWGQLAELEPQIETLLWRTRLVGADCRTFADVDRAFRSLQYELADLVGFAGKHHRHPVLGSVGAYEVAYWKLYDAMAGLLASHQPGDTRETPEKQQGETAAATCPRNLAATGRAAGPAEASRTTGGSKQGKRSVR